MNNYWVNIIASKYKVTGSTVRLSFVFFITLFSFSFSHASPHHQSTLNLQQSLFNQKNFEQKNYEFTDIDINTSFRWKSNSNRYHHNLGVNYQKSSSLEHFTPRVTEVYYGNVQKNYSIFLGRKLGNWSTADGEWNLGLTQPLFNIDYLNPLAQGLTGVHFNWKRKKIYLQSFLSYLNLPHQGPGFDLRDNRFESLNPWFSLPPKQIQERGVLTNVRYRVNEPQVQDVIFRGSGAIKFGYRDKKGWASIGYLNKINSSFHNSYLFSEETAGSSPGVLANVEVGTKRHEVYTLDMGRSWDETTVWISYMKDKPNGSYDRPAEWVETDLSEQDWLSAGVRWRHLFINDLNVSTSYIKRYDQNSEKPTLIRYPELADVFSRTYFNRSESLQLKINYKYRLGRKKELSLQNRYEYSLADRGQLTSARLNYRNNSYQVFFEGGVISASQNNDNTFFSKYKGNDFLRVGGSFAF